jgi:Ni/Fe-hydrogenase subunit HybB-like protein
MDNRQKIIGEDRVLFDPIHKTGKRFYITLSVLASLALWGVFAYVTQYRTGLAVTGLSRQIFWGVYITNFVFFIGISHAGTFISAILRVTQAEWRRPITRASELITVIVLFFGVASLLIDLGRPDRMLYAIRYAHFRSPLLWDVCSIGVYFTCSFVYLYLALIPDIGLLRDLGGKRQWLYRILALGWEGTEQQHERLEKAILFMAVLVIPVAVSVHTVVSYVFAMTIQPMWHSAIFGPYFVVGAIFSGVASVILVMAVLRKAYHLEAYIKPIHFNHIGVFLLAMTLLWFYFTFAEYITVFYGHEPVHMAIFWSKLTGKFAPLFWLHFVLCFVLPLPVLAAKRTRTIRGTVLASISILFGMWIERFVIIVPTLTRQRMSVEQAFYTPTWVEWSILSGCISLFMLLYALFTKIFPIISVWEIREGRETAVATASDRIRSYLPDTSAEK